MDLGETLAWGVAEVGGWGEGGESGGWERAGLDQSRHPCASL